MPDTPDTKSSVTSGGQNGDATLPAAAGAEPVYPGIPAYDGPMRGTILLVEDDFSMGTLVQDYLLHDEYKVVWVRNGTEALAEARRRPFSLVLLDIGLPDIDGFDVCRTLKGFCDVPVIILTARGEEADRVAGLEIGADDYLTKPFSFQELLARVRALLRRVAYERTPSSETAIRIGAVALDTDAHRVTLDGQALQMTQMEYKLLQTLMERAGHVVRRNDLMDMVWGADWVGDTHTLDVHIRWLRQKIEAEPGHPRCIQTVRGVGYRFATPEEVET